MIYSYHDLKQVFDSNILEWAASRLVKAHIHANIQREGEVISGLVQTNTAKPWRVYVRIITLLDSTLDFRGECSCRKSNCEHVAMLLLEALDDTTVTSEPFPPDTIKKHVPKKRTDLHMLYVMNKGGASYHFNMQLFTARQLDSGKFGRTTPYSLSGCQLRSPPRFLTKPDLDIFRNLNETGTDASNQPFKLHSDFAQELFCKVLETGYCFYTHPAHPALGTGNVRQVTSCWKCDESGNQELSLKCTPAAELFLLTDALWYVDISTGCCGETSCDIEIKIIKHLLLAGPISPEQVQKREHELQQQCIGIPPLKRLEMVAIPKSTPSPVITIMRDKSANLRAQLQFEYQGVRLSDSSRTRQMKEDQVFDICRDHAFETSCREKLIEYGLQVIPGQADNFELLDDAQKKHWFMLIGVAELRLEGWQLEFSPELGVQFIEPGDWSAQLKPHDNNNHWFTLDLGITVDGKTISLLPVLVTLLSHLPGEFSRSGMQMLADDLSINVPLPDGRLMPLPLRRLRPVFDNLLEFIEQHTLNDNGSISLNRYQGALISELGECVQWHGDKELIDMAKRLRGIKTVPVVDPPENLRASLRPYQQTGLDWLQFLSAHDFSGILADDMGLGKTLQTLAHIQLEKNHAHLDRPCLVVAPTSLLFNWRREAEKFTPQLRVLTLYGPQRHSDFSKIPEYDLVLTSYALLVRDEDKHSAYHLMVLDEAQAIKNPAAKSAQAARRINTRHRLCLTGTPMENHLGELWSLFDFLMSGFLGTQRGFEAFFRRPIEKFNNVERSELLARRVKPFLLRRGKEMVVKELPSCSEILHNIELQGDQRQLYESIRLPLQKQIQTLIQQKGLAGNHIMVLDALLKLRQVCCDPRLVKLKAAAGIVQSAKLELLVELLPQMLEEGRRILVFSQFTSMLALIASELDTLGIRYTTLTGQTRDREGAVECFQNGDVPLFLISLKAGGTGLNLTTADTVIHYDPWWNPAVERQATARAHRIGQEKPVFVYKLISLGTVEERIYAMQQRKQALADSVYEDDDGKSVEIRWSEEDMKQLFEPLT